MQHKSIQTEFSIKEVGDSGTFEGLGSVFDVTDSGGDVVEKGAFKESLSELNSKNRQPALLWQHDRRQPIGKYTEVKETDDGLYVKGQLALKTPRGAEAYELLKMDALSGLSIGYSIPKGGAEFDEKEDVYRLKTLNLWEVSLVTFPMNDEARVSQVKTSLSTGAIPDRRELERFLRDSGMSRKQAVAFVASGYTAAFDSESDSQRLEENESVIALLAALQKMKGKESNGDSRNSS